MPGENNIRDPSLKNKYRSRRKKILHRYMSGKKISYFRGWEKILTQTDLPLRHKSQMVHHIGPRVGKKRI